MEESKPVAVVFSGAGLSAESGIPTFRDSNGLWHNYKVEDVANPEGWKKDKELVLRFYAERFEGMKFAEPNDAHKAIAKLQDKFQVVNITQNIDNLLERAGCEHVEHLHGLITVRKCERHKEIATVSSGWDTDSSGFTCDYKDDQTESVKLGDLCPKCGGQLRPDVVWFGEAVHMDHRRIIRLVREVKYKNGVFIVVGTSAEVAPASSLIPLFSQVPRKYIVDLRVHPIADYTLCKGLATEEMPKLVKRLM